MPRLPGVVLQDPDLRKSWTQGDRIAVARAMGDGLGRLQMLRFSHVGKFDPAMNAIAPATETYGAWYAAAVRDWTARCVTASEESIATDVGWVESIIASASPALDVALEPAFVHGDYAEGNVVAQRTGDGWRVSGVFDLQGCRAGDGEVDLARLTAAYSRHGRDVVAAFLNAYFAHRPMRDGFAERMRLYMLTDRLIFWEYGQRNRVWFTPGMTFRAWAEEYVAYPLPGLGNRSR
jgi:Ser/Thr protein kinase RdoA (MazF antagonist)